MYYMGMHQIVNPSVIIDVSHDNCLVNGKKIISYNQRLHLIFWKASKTDLI